MVGNSSRLPARVHQGIGLNLDLLTLRVRKLVAIAQNSFYRRGFLEYGVAPAIEHRSVLSGLSCDFVVDVGANRGQFSLLCRHLWPQARLVAFEPQPDPARIYRALFNADSGVRLYECALAPQRQEMTLHVSGQDDSSSLLPISQAQTDNYPGTQVVQTRQVPAGPLSDYVMEKEIGAASLLKIDVQGFELEVLKSAQSLLHGFRWIYAECSYVSLYEGQALADEVIAWLEARNFRLAGRFNLTLARRDGSLLQADFLFERA